MEKQSENNGNFPQESNPASEELPKNSEAVGSGSKESSEIDKQFRNRAERTEDHSVTVRDAAKIFEEANLPVTERTIINWCNPNKRGLVRLDCYFDEGDGKYFITPQSIEQVIKEESPRAKSRPHVPFNISEGQERDSEPYRNASGERPKVSEGVRKDAEAGSENFGDGGPGATTGENNDQNQLIRQLRHQLMDERILNKGKDYYIERLQNDRAMLLEQTVSQGRRIGQLETELRQLQAPRNGREETHSPIINQLEHDEEESPQSGGQVNDRQSQSEDQQEK